MFQENVSNTAYFCIPVMPNRRLTCRHEGILFSMPTGRNS